MLKLSNRSLSVDNHEKPFATELFKSALDFLSPSKDYLSKPFDEAFNWQQVIDHLPIEFTGTFYIVAFRSKLVQPPVNLEILNERDWLAHAEAKSSGGLLKYWYQSADGHGRNLATCIWESRQDATKASALPWHARAMQVVGMGVYEEWGLERFTLKIDSCRFHFERL